MLSRKRRGYDLLSTEGGHLPCHNLTIVLAKLTILLLATSCLAYPASLLGILKTKGVGITGHPPLFMTLSGDVRVPAAS